MNWQDLYQKIAFLDTAVAEDKGDMDKDGKNEPDSKEYLDNKDAAIKKATGDKDVDEDTNVEECGPMGGTGSQPDNVSMNVSLNGSGAGGIRDLMNVLKNIENGDSDSDSHDHSDDGDMAIKLGKMADEEFENKPDTDYKDINYMTKDLAGGLNSEHGQYKKEYPGDNPMAVKQLEAKLTSMYEAYKQQ